MVDSLRDITESERATLNFLTRKFNQALTAGQVPPPDIFISYLEGDLQSRLPLPAVAFLGIRKPHPDFTVEALISELDTSMTHPHTASHHGLLYYHATKLPDQRNYADISVFRSPELIRKWLHNGDHQLAVEMASHVFAHISLFRMNLHLSNQDPQVDFQIESRRVISF